MTEPVPVAAGATRDGAFSADRRRLLSGATAALAGAGIGAAAVPFVSSMKPSARTQAAGAPIAVPLAGLAPGKQVTVEWRRKPVWVLRRTQEQIDDLANPTLAIRLRDPDSKISSQQPEYMRNRFRSLRPDILVAVAVCTHLGCVPTYRPDRAPADLGAAWMGGYFCPCHGSRFDLAGRVFKGVPAPTNLLIPPYRFESDDRLLVGENPVSG